MSRLHSRWVARLLVAACILWTSTLPAQRPTTARDTQPFTYVRQHIDATDGLPDAQITAVAQTPDGYLWLGTRRGLVRYDGVSFTTFGPENTKELPSGSINSLMAEPDGSLWISTARGLVLRSAAGFRRIEANQVPAVSIWRVMRDRQSRLWVTGAFGLRVGDGTQFRPIPSVDAYLYGIAQAADGRIWLAGRDYLAVLTDVSAQPIIAPFSASRRFFDVMQDRRGAMWVGDRTGALRVDADDQRVSLRQTIRTSLGARDANVWSLAEDAQGFLWLGTSTRGALRWDGQRLAAPNAPSPETAEAVWGLARDMRGRMWAGTVDGLVLYARSPFVSDVRGLGARATWSVRIDNQDTKWAATGEGQVWRLGANGWVPVRSVRRNEVAANTMPLRGGGLLVVDEEGHTSIASSEGMRPGPSLNFPPGSSVFSVFEDTDGSFWSTTSAGIIHHVSGRAINMHGRLGLEGRDRPSAIWRDRKGRLLVARPYLTIMEGDSVRRLGVREGLTDPEVNTVFDDGTQLFLGTSDSGLFVVRGDSAMGLAPRNPRLRRDIVGITRDGVGALWLSSTTGLLRIDRRDLEPALISDVAELPVRLFDRIDGLPSLEFFSERQSVLSHDAAGGIWLPSYAGPVRLDPLAVFQDALPPQVHLEQVTVDGSVRPLSDTLELPPRPNRIEVTFAATNALVPHRARAAYRIRGIDSAWSDLGNRRTLAFGPLQGGWYEVEVRVASEDGPWNPQTAMLVLHVRLAWYEQPAFYLLALAALAGIVGLIIRHRTAVAERRARQLEAIVTERTAALEASRATLEQRVQERTAALAHQLEERTQLEHRLAAAKKLESLGRLAGGVSHEINNALTSVLGFAQLAEGSAGDNPAVRADLEEVVRAGRRAADITRQLLAFAKRQQTQLVAVAPAEFLTSLARALQQLLPDTMRLRIEVAPELPTIRADQSQLEQLLVNLVKNARDASSPAGQIIVCADAIRLSDARTVRDQILAAGAYVRLAVRDFGAGIDHEIRDQLFDPFFTTKEELHGTGLGLSVCQGIVARHQGAIELESTPGTGTSFIAWFPVPESMDAVRPANEGSAYGVETILLVDDEPGIRAVASRVLTMHGYRVLDAPHGQAALERYQQAGETIDAVVTDVLMPQMTGLQLARRLRAQRPTLPMVFISGFAGIPDDELQELRAIGPLLAKPFTSAALAQMVRSVLDADRVGTASG